MKIKIIVLAVAAALAACTADQQANVDRTLALGCLADGKYIPVAQAAATTAAAVATPLNPAVGAGIVVASTVDAALIHPAIQAACAAQNAAPVAVPVGTPAGAAVPASMAVTTPVPPVPPAALAAPK